MAREYIPYIEKGEIGLDTPFAKGVCQGVNDILGSFVAAHINLDDLDKIDIKQPGNRLDPFLVDIPETPHKVFLTRRFIVHPETELLKEYEGTIIAGICVYQEGKYDKTLSVASIPVARTEPDLDVAVGTLTHELVHSLGVQHCHAARCLMQPKLPETVIGDLALVQSPFCYPHAKTLETLSAKLLIK